MDNIKNAGTQNLRNYHRNPPNLENSFLASGILVDVSPCSKVLEIDIGGADQYPSGVSWHVREADRVSYEAEFGTEEEELRVVG